MEVRVFGDVAYLFCLKELGFKLVCFKYCFVDITAGVDFVPMPCQMFGYLLFRSGTSRKLLQLTSSIYQYMYIAN